MVYLNSVWPTNLFKTSILSDMEKYQSDGRVILLFNPENLTLLTFKILSHSHGFEK